ncbi:beta-N-acetylhexosaminidase [Litchfieldella rifensis]|uniref:beta-N-acetylhexosaminidase n=1 Tax=Litchfieldella rifensis TaxID=762643 RepID=A0ABV7LNJ2_9GAMM
MRQLRLRLENHHAGELRDWHLHLNLVRGVRQVVSGNARLVRQTGSHCLLAMTQRLGEADHMECVLELEVPVVRVTKLPLAAYVVASDHPNSLPVTVCWSGAETRDTGAEAKTVDLPGLIPWPRYVEWLPGRFSLGEETAIGPGPQEAAHAARWLRDGIVDQCRGEVTFVEPGHIRFQHAAGLEPASYELVVEPDSVCLTAADAAGFLHAAATLLQLLPARPMNDRDAAWSLPCVRITDGPRFAYRGLMLDCARHFHPVSRILRLLDLMARLKLNVFHWHLTDDEGWRLEIRAFPALTDIGAWRGHDERLEPQYYSGAERSGGFYTQADVRRVVEHAARLGIEVVPEIDMPAHSRAAILALPELLQDPDDRSVYLSDQRYSDNVLSPALEGTYIFVDRVMDEVCELFPGPWVHVGGDEVPEGVWRGSSRCRELMQREGYTRVEELTSHFLRYVQRYLQANGKRMMGWEEVLHGPDLDPELVAFAWTSHQAVTAMLPRNVTLVLQPRECMYFDLAQSDDFHEPGLNWAGEVSLAQVHRYDPWAGVESGSSTRERFLGMQAALWSELVSSRERMDYMLFPRLTAFAEVAWHAGGQPSYEDYLERISAYLPHLDRLGVNYRRLDREEVATLGAGRSRPIGRPGKE